MKGAGRGAKAFSVLVGPAKVGVTQPWGGLGLQQAGHRRSCVAGKVAPLCHSCSKGFPPCVLAKRRRGETTACRARGGGGGVAPVPAGPRDPARCALKQQQHLIARQCCLQPHDFEHARDWAGNLFLTQIVRSQRAPIPSVYSNE
jgi:hypothetical protein